MYVVSPAEVRGAYFGTSATDRNFEGFTFVDESAAHYMHQVVGQQRTLHAAPKATKKSPREKSKDR
jgi:hypothetical protein